MLAFNACLVLPCSVYTLSAQVDGNQNFVVVLVHNVNIVNTDVSFVNYHLFLSHESFQGSGTCTYTILFMLMHLLWM